MNLIKHALLVLRPLTGGILLGNGIVQNHWLLIPACLMGLSYFIYDLNGNLRKWILNEK